MAEATRGVIPAPVSLSLPDSGQIAVACPVCADRVAIADAVVTPAGIEVTIPPDQHALLDLHRAKYHPTEGEF